MKNIKRDKKTQKSVTSGRDVTRARVRPCHVVTRDMCRDITHPEVVTVGVTATGRHGREFVWTGLVPYQKANGHGTYLAQWQGTCATCGDAFEVLTPVGVLTDGKTSKVFDLANCQAHRGNKLVHAHIEPAGIARRQR